MADRKGKKAAATLCQGTAVADMLQANKAFKGMGDKDGRKAKIEEAIRQLRRNAKLKEGTKVTVAGVHYSVGKIANERGLYGKICKAIEVPA